MRAVLILCVISLMVASSLAAVGIIPADKTPGHPGHCNSDSTGPMSEGETKQMKGCSQATCNRDGSIGLTSCGVSVVHGDCSKIPTYEDVKGKPYPQCCVPRCEKE